MKGVVESRGAIRERVAFVLLTVVIVLAVAVTLSSSIASRSLSLTLEANRRQEACQRHWLRTTLTRHVLPAVILTHHNHPSAVYETTLNGLPLRFRVADEQAKFHAGLLGERVGPSRAGNFLASHAGPFVLARLSGTEGMTGWRRLLRQSLSLDWKDIEDVSPNITFWGDGRLHLRTTSDVRLRSVLTAQIGLSETEQFLQLLSEQPNAALDELLEQSALRRSQSDALEHVVTDQSQAMSAWFHWRGETEFHVLAKASNNRYYVDSVVP